MFIDFQYFSMAFAGFRHSNGCFEGPKDFRLSPLSFLCHALWLELWLRIAWPSGAEEKLAQLPRRFRQVGFKMV